MSQNTPEQPAVVTEILIKFKQPMRERQALYEASAALGAISNLEPGETLELPDAVEDVQIGEEVDTEGLLPGNVHHPDAI